MAEVTIELKAKKYATCHYMKDVEHADFVCKESLIRDGLIPRNRQYRVEYDPIQDKNIHLITWEGWEIVDDHSD